jgi:threonine dehydrogenase-like Zn-dependent dehydrogenase
VLLEPTSIVAKAWDHTERIGQRARSWRPRTLLVTGAGPIGLIAAMIGVQRGLDVHVVDHEDHQQKHDLVRSLGAAYHAGGLAKLNGRFKPDILMECSGAPPSCVTFSAAPRPAASYASSASLHPAMTSTSMSGSSTAPWCSTTTPCSAP